MLFWYPYFGPGPRRDVRTSLIRIGKTHASFDLDLPPRGTATGINFAPRSTIARQSGETELQVQISTTSATIVGTRITVEIQVDTNPGQVQLDIPTYEVEVTVGANENGQVVFAKFPIKTTASNPNSGQVGFRATITRIEGPRGEPVENECKRKQ